MFQRILADGSWNNAIGSELDCHISENTFLAKSALLEMTSITSMWPLLMCYRLKTRIAINFVEALFMLPASTIVSDRLHQFGILWQEILA